MEKKSVEAAAINILFDRRLDNSIEPMNASPVAR
jgi:hypothetical protein